MNKSSFYLKLILVLFVLWAVVMFTISVHQIPENSNEPVILTQEDAFINTINSAKQEYDEAHNEMKNDEIRHKRKEALRSIVPDYKASNWFGVITEITTTFDNGATLTVKIAPDISIETFNNEISDVETKTIIRQKNTVFKQLYNLKAGDKVKFSGIFLSSDEDFLRENSISTEGSLQEPEFLFKFTSIESAN